MLSLAINKIEWFGKTNSFCATGNPLPLSLSSPAKPLEGGQVSFASIGLASHLALYGNVGLVRKYCGYCRTKALVVDGVLACCDRKVSEADTKPTVARRMSEPMQKRKPASAAVRRRILKQQGDVCLYCSRSFGSLVVLNGREKILRVNWDHRLPYAYSFNNQDENFAAACHVCNAWKSDLVFRTLEEARIHLALKWAQAESEKPESEPMLKLPESQN